MTMSPDYPDPKSIWNEVGVPVGISGTSVSSNIGHPFQRLHSGMLSGGFGFSETPSALQAIYTAVSGAIVALILLLVTAPSVVMTQPKNQYEQPVLSYTKLTTWACVTGSTAGLISYFLNDGGCV